MATIAQARSRLRVGQPRKVALVSQRVEDPPFLNCRLFEWMQRARWAGLRWEGGRETTKLITDLIRRHCGRPEFISGKAQGTTSADLDRGLAAVFPWMRQVHRLVDDDELLDGLGRLWVAGVAVWLPDLPTRQQRFTGSGAIGHAIGLMDARKSQRAVRYLDPLGSLPYGGDWVGFGAIRPAFMQRGTGSTFCSLMEVGDPMLTAVIPVKAFAGGGATATLPKGRYRSFRVQGDDFERVADLVLDAKAELRVGYVAQVDQKPARGPEGRFAFVIEGPGKGRFLRAADVQPLAEPVVGTPDLEAAIARARMEGRAEAEAEFRPVELPDDVYERMAP